MLFSVLLLATTAGCDVVAKLPWPRSRLLHADSGFTLAWDPHPDFAGRFHFALRVYTSGYIGFGLSDTGTMAGADLLIAWPTVTDNTTKLTMLDLYAAQNGLPSEDDHSDWQLQGGSWKPDTKQGSLGGVLELHLTRLLDTGDPHDLPITDQSMYILYAWGDNREVEYHLGGQRGAIWLQLLGTHSSAASNCIPTIHVFIIILATLQMIKETTNKF